MAERHDEWPEGGARRGYGADGGAAGSDYTGYRAGEGAAPRGYDETYRGSELGATAREADREASDAGTTPDPAALRADIRETRERLGDTLEELGERLNPSLLKHQVTQQVREHVRDATIGRVEHMARHAADRVSETRSTMIDTIRENPIPAAMAAFGLGWLFMNRSRRPSYPGGRSRTAGGRAKRTSSASST